MSRHRAKRRRESAKDCILLLQRRDYPRHTREEETELARTSKNVDSEGSPTPAAIDARQRLVLSCVPWAANVATKFFYTPLARRANADLRDLLSEAMLVLCRAVRRFDPERGLRFTTYVGHAIWNDLSKFIRKHGHCVTLPVRDPKDEDLHNSASQVWAGVLSLDAGADLCPRATEAEPEDDTLDRLRHRYATLAPVCSARERDTLRMRAEGMRYSDIAKIMGVTKSRVGQIVMRAIKRLQDAEKDVYGDSVSLA